ncbi:hypothetical protein [Porticoccus sp.]
MTQKKTVSIAVCIIWLLYIVDVHASESGISYINADEPFLEITEVNRQAEAWAMCSAAYDTLAYIVSDSSPARSQQLSELAGGAEIAIIMATVADSLHDEMTQEKFDAVWNIAKSVSTEMPGSMRTFLAAEIASTSNTGTSTFFDNLSATVTVCVKNLPSQEFYIGMWRELAKSGLRYSPDE